MKISRYNKISFYSVILLVFFCFLANSVLASSSITKESIISLVNQSRKESNIGALEENEKLDQAAKEKLEDMFKNNYFSHNSPSGVTPWFWIEKAEYDYHYAGENLALGFASVESEHKAWMESPSHRKNILNPNYKEIGVAVGEGKINNNVVTVAVQMFGARMENSAGSKEENNMSDEKADELLDKNKKENKGIVLNTGIFNQNNNKPLAFQNNPSFRDLLLKDKNFLKNSIWMASFSMLAICMFSNIITALIFVFHRIAHLLRRNRNALMIVHSIMIFILMGSIIF